MIVGLQRLVGQHRSPDRRDFDHFESWQRMAACATGKADVCDNEARRQITERFHRRMKMGAASRFNETLPRGAKRAEHLLAGLAYVDSLRAVRHVDWRLQFTTKAEGVEVLA